MCRSAAEGGQRCPSFTAKELASAAVEVEAAGESLRAHRDRAVSVELAGGQESRLERVAREKATRRVAAAQARLTSARIAHAATEQGRLAMQVEANGYEVLAGRAGSLRERERYLLQALELRDAIKRGEALQQVNAEVAAVLRHRRTVAAAPRVRPGGDPRPARVVAGGRDGGMPVRTPEPVGVG